MNATVERKIDPTRQGGDIKSGEKFRKIPPMTVAQALAYYDRVLGWRDVQTTNHRAMEALVNEIRKRSKPLRRSRRISCKKNFADYPSKFCAGCEAYQEHLR